MVAVDNPCAGVVVDPGRAALALFEDPSAFAASAFGGKASVVEKFKRLPAV